MTMQPDAKPDGSPSWASLRDDADHCQQCGAALPDDNMWGWRRFCSNRCRNRWHYEDCPEAFTVPRHGERACQTCGGKFLARTAKQKFCGHPCYWTSKRGKPLMPALDEVSETLD